MYQTMKWPLALVVSCTILLGGCGGGGGGGGDSSGSGGGSNSSDGGPTGGSTDAPDASDGSGGVTPVEGTGDAPSGDGPAQPTFTAYTVIIEAPQVVSERVQATNLDRMVAAITQLVAPYAQAQSTPALRVEDVRVALMRGDNQGTPDDASDDTDRYLIRGQDYRVEQSGPAVIVQLPFEPRVDHYIEVAPGGTGGLSVPTYQSDLVADPVSTLLTHILSRRAAQLDQLTVQEVNELLLEIKLLAENLKLSEAIAHAYASANSTQALIDALSPHLFAILDASVEDKLAPPVQSNALATAGGEYYFQSLDLGSFDGIQGKGVAIGGTKRNAGLASVGGGKFRAAVEPAESLTYQAMHIYTQYGSAEIHTSISEAAEVSTLEIDSRGLTAPKSTQEISCSQPQYWSYVYWISRTENCTDRKKKSEQRFLAAGTPEAPFSTLVSSPLSTRRLDDGNRLPLEFTTGSLQLGIKKPTSMQQLFGEYGVLQVSHFDRSHSFEIEMTLIDATHVGQKINYCQRAYRGLNKSMSSFYPVRQFLFDNDDCVAPIHRYVYTTNAYFDNNGAFDFSGSRGYVSADGLTYLGYSQSPSAEQLTDAGQISGLEQDGSHLVQFAVKRDTSNTLLENKRYRLMGVGAGASQYTLEANRIMAGTLEFDDSGRPTMQAAEQSERVLHDGSTESQPNNALNEKFHDVRYKDGRLWMRTGNMDDDVIARTTLQGYVQEGGRVLLLWREVVTNEDYNSLGVLVGVCMNCD